MGLQPGQNITINVRSIGATACQTSSNATLTASSNNPMGNNLYVPNTFTPNGDGKNDIFYAYGSAVAKFNLRVYNQWGEFIFESQDLGRGWDGTYRGSLQPNGVYVYYIDVTFNDGTSKIVKGTITLLR
jgi:gliding motility-associated-like protein